MTRRLLPYEEKIVQRWQAVSMRSFVEAQVTVLIHGMTPQARSWRKRLIYAGFGVLIASTVVLNVWVTLAGM